MLPLNEIRWGPFHPLRPRFFMSVESRDRKTNREKFSPHSELASAQVFASEARGGGTDSVAWGSQMLIILNIFFETLMILN